MAVRFKCVLFGCNCRPDAPVCMRCGEGIYNDFVQRGLIEEYFSPLIHGYRIAKAWILDRTIGRKCHQCGKHYYRGYDEYMCSSECFDEWLPF